jgi:carboxyl-terminal processing protease
MSNKKNLLYAVVVIVLLGAVYLLGMTQGYYGRLTAANYSTIFKSELSGKKIGDADLNLLWDVIRTVDAKFFGTANYRDMAYGAIRGAVEALGDKYTVFTDPEENKQFFNALDGVYEGVGIEVDIQEGQLTVVAPLKGSPADAAGIQPGDVISAVDGKTVIGMSLAEAISNIKGPSGSFVKLTIIREGGTPFVVSIKRQTIKQASVDLEIDGDGIATIRIVRFAGDTEAGLNKAVENIIKAKAKGVVLDLRGNPGGFLDAGVKVANEFIKEGVIVEERPKAGQSTFFSADGHSRLADIPLVVLVNGGSASASEIVAGALQDHKRAVIVGEKTYGKGSVQEVESFPDGSALRMTVAKWYTPDGRSISEQGVQPDQVVEFDSESKTDKQMEEAKALLRKS